MNNLDKYIIEKKEELLNKKITNELEIIKYIYIDLGKRFSFNEKFIPFGNSKFKQNLYKYHSKNISDLNECMDTNIVICKSLSYILEYVFKSFNIDIQTIIDSLDHISCPHVYNFIKISDGRKFCVDLQEDINAIQTHSFTNSFGFESPFSNKLIVTRKEQEIIDRKLGYITNDNYYSDDYLYLLHSISDGIEDFREKVKFILENIDYSNTDKMGYIDRQWHHKNVLEKFFNQKEFDYQSNSGKIRIYDGFIDVDSERKYINFILVMDKGEIDIYIYDENNSNYLKIDVEEYFNYLNNGLKIHNSKLPYIKRKNSKE